MPTITNIHGELTEVAILTHKVWYPGHEEGPSIHECRAIQAREPFRVSRFEGKYQSDLFYGTRAECEKFIADRQSAEATRAAGQRLAEVA